MNKNGNDKNGWGSICVATRLEKMVESQFVWDWSHLITTGLRPGDSFIIVKDRVAHWAANEAVRGFLKSDNDTLCFLDSDASVGPGFVESLRVLEAGFEYDIFQAFYVRRGWPPEAIWFKESALGDLMQCLVYKDDNTEETALVGLHCVLIRREVFETVLNDNPDENYQTFDWFWYPRHKFISEDSAFSGEARKKYGFKIGSTTAVKAGHISRVVTGWETYQEQIRLSGTWEKWEEYYNLVELIADFTGQDPDTVIANAVRGTEGTYKAFEKAAPRTPEEYREFYGAEDNGYLYDLLAWNTSPFYHQIIEPLKAINEQKVIVMGGGLGSEVEVLKDRNKVDVYELPGVLRDFMLKRFYKQPSVYIWDDADNGHLGPMIDKILGVGLEYDLLVAVDVVEHIHPDEFEETLDKWLQLLKPGGAFYLHNNFGQQDSMPMHFDHDERFKDWLKKNKIETPDAEFGFYRRLEK